VLEPWEQAIVSHGTKYDGPPGEAIRLWGGRRLVVLARLLPLAERFDVYLLGTGLPSFWVAQMGDMRLTLGLSGWTANDWTHGSAIDMLAPPGVAPAGLVNRAAEYLRTRRDATFDDVRGQLMTEPANVAAALNHLAHTGQLIYDLSAGRYRWRQIMARALGELELGPPNPELVASREIVARRRVKLEKREQIGTGLLFLAGVVDNKPVEMVLDADGLIKRAKCVCSHHYKAGIRMGPCRHLLALRTVAQRGDGVDDATNTWYEKLRKWANN
jgi:hypothetical protein